MATELQFIINTDPIVTAEFFNMLQRIGDEIHAEAGQAEPPNDAIAPEFVDDDAFEDPDAEHHVQVITPSLRPRRRRVSVKKTNQTNESPKEELDKIYKEARVSSISQNVAAMTPFEAKWLNDMLERSVKDVNADGRFMKSLLHSRLVESTNDSSMYDNIEDCENITALHGAWDELTNDSAFEETVQNEVKALHETVLDEMNCLKKELEKGSEKTAEKSKSDNGTSTTNANKTSKGKKSNKGAGGLTVDENCIIHFNTEVYDSEDDEEAIKENSNTIRFIKLILKLYAEYYKFIHDNDETYMPKRGNRTTHMNMYNIEKANIYAHMRFMKEGVVEQIINDYLDYIRKVWVVHATKFRPKDDSMVSTNAGEEHNDSDNKNDEASNAESDKNANSKKKSKRSPPNTTTAIHGLSDVELKYDANGFLNSLQFSNYDIEKFDKKLILNTNHTAYIDEETAKIEKEKLEQENTKLHKNKIASVSTVMHEHNLCDVDINTPCFVKDSDQAIIETTVSAEFDMLICFVRSICKFFMGDIADTYLKLSDDNTKRPEYIINNLSKAKLATFFASDGVKDIMKELLDPAFDAFDERNISRYAADNVTNLYKYITLHNDFVKPLFLRLFICKKYIVNDITRLKSSIKYKAPLKSDQVRYKLTTFDEFVRMYNHKNTIEPDEYYTKHFMKKYCSHKREDKSYVNLRKVYGGVNYRNMNNLFLFCSHMLSKIFNDELVIDESILSENVKTKLLADALPEDIECGSVVAAQLQNYALLIERMYRDFVMGRSDKLELKLSKINVVALGVIVNTWFNIYGVHSFMLCADEQKLTKPVRFEYDESEWADAEVEDGVETRSDVKVIGETTPDVNVETDAPTLAKIAKRSKTICVPNKPIAIVKRDDNELQHRMQVKTLLDSDLSFFECIFIDNFNEKDFVEYVHERIREVEL